MPALVERPDPDVDLGEHRRRRRARWNDLRKRVLSAALLAPIALACIWFGAEAWMALMALGAAGLSAEWVALCGRRAWTWPGLVVPVSVLLGSAAAVLDRPGIGLLILLAAFSVLWRTSRSASLASGILYVGIGSLALLWLRDGGAAVGRANLLFLVLAVWASDIGAYVAGRLLGGPRLAPALSPGKTWSGALGGLLTTVVVGAAAALWLAPLSLGRAVVIAGLLGIASQAGDLFESWIKRRFGVKDSSHLIPGHGGLLDRMDGMLAAAPAAAALAWVVGRGSIMWH